MVTQALDRASIQEAAQVLRSGGLVAFPTETVYGLGANACDGQAVARIYEAKGRPTFNPLIVHVASLAHASKLVRFCDDARKLAEAFWPGALTLVLERADGSPVCDLVSAGLPTIAVRAPAHKIARELLAQSGVPIAAPSANRSGHVSATQAAHVTADLEGRVDVVLDGGVCELGLESTVVAFGTSVAQGTGGPVTVLRSGAIAASEIERVVGWPVARAASMRNTRALSPGQLKSHYATRALLRLEALEVLPGEALLAFGPNVPETNGACINLSASADLVEAAANLFGALRELDRSGARQIAVMPVPQTGLGEAINDRLARAAAPRPTPQRGTL